MQERIDEYRNGIRTDRRNSKRREFENLLRGYQTAVQNVLKLEDKDPTKYRMSGDMRSVLKKLNFD